MAPRSKRYGKKRTSKPRRRAPRRKITNVNLVSMTPIAQRYITKMKYSQPAVLAVTNGYVQVMNLNSVFDPDRTGVGHQPYGFDQLAALYNRYRVIGCSYNITAYNGTTPIRFGALPTNEVPPIGNLDELCENPRSRWAIQVPGGNTKMIKGYVSIPSLTGRTKAQYMADDRYQSTVTGNPQELALLSIYAQTLANVNVDVNVTITMNYTVEFFDPVPLDQS